jgi:L-asparaginase II
LTLQAFHPLVTVSRGGEIESYHSVAAVIVAGDGRVLHALGDGDVPIYWRSAAKPFQALPLVESGAADRFSLTTEELALICASHGGESCHLKVARQILGHNGFGPEDLQCGAHAPMTAAAARELVIRGEEPETLHNNCSGKHGGMLLLTHHLGGDPDSYLESGAPAQNAILAAISRVSGVASEQIGQAVDGCSAPTFRLPLEALARSYARLAAALAVPKTDPALARIGRAMTRHPLLVAGEGRLDTLLMEAAPGKIVAKLGAEGVYAMAVTTGNQPLGIAFKIADGDADRARTAVALALLRRLRLLPEAALADLEKSFPREIYNRRKRVIGHIKVNLPEKWGIGTK